MNLRSFSGERLPVADRTAAEIPAVSMVNIWAPAGEFMRLATIGRCRKTDAGPVIGDRPIPADWPAACKPSGVWFVYEPEA